MSRPWEMPIWKPARGKEGVLLYLVAIHVLAVIGLILYPIPSIPVFLTTLTFTLLGDLGTTVCNHRYLAHRTLKLNKAVEHFFVFWTVFNGSGSPAHWAANHRLHHAKADSMDDVSSPTHGGFWWAHLRWLYQTPPADMKRWAPDLNKPEYHFWERAETIIVLLAMFGGLAFGWRAFFWVGAIRLVYSIHLQWELHSAARSREVKLSRAAASSRWRLLSDQIENRRWRFKLALAPVDGSAR